MARYKTFNSTGIAPDGRLYAGDLNAIQDFLAAASDFTQTVDLATLRIGETGLQLTRYGTGEARITGLLRTDGMVRAGGGLLAGTFTTTQRDAISTGQRPPGLTIYNTTVNRYETNFGTDATPVWGLAGEPIAGVMWPWPYAEAGVPNGWALCYGQLVPKATNPQLDALAAAAGYPHGSDASNVRLPDMRGRIPVGKDNMGGAAAARVGTSNAGQTLGGTHGKEDHKLLSTELAIHSHTVNSHAHTVNSHNHPGSGVAEAGNMGGWTSSDGWHTHPPSGDYYHAQSDGAVENMGTQGALRYRITSVPGATGGAGAHTHGVGINNHAHGLVLAAESPGTTSVAPGTTNAGTDAFHNNLQPGLILNWIIKLG